MTGEFMRRVMIGSAATAGMTTLLLLLPVHAQSAPPPVPVRTAVQEIPLGTVSAPRGGGDVQQGTTEDVPGYETMPVLTATQAETPEFSLVAVTWSLDPAVRNIALRLRVYDDAGSPSGWTDLGTDDVGTAPNPEATANGEQRGGSEARWVGPSFGVELEVLTLTGADPQDVRLILLDPGDSPADAAPSHPQNTVEPSEAAANAAPPIYSRAQWGADESIRSWKPEYASTTKAATLHHTADSNDYDAEDVPALLRGIYYYHAVSRGWGDIGYNAVVDKFGRIWEGRYGGIASSVIGAHAGGFNTFTFGVSMLGNYDVVGTPPAMIDAVVAVIAWKLGLYGVNPLGSTQLVSGGGGTSRHPAGQTVTLPTIFGHRDVGSTTCPGQYGYARLDEIRTRVAGQTPLTDISNAAVAAARAASGQTTIVVRGADSTLFTRTRTIAGEWGPYTALPAGVSTLGVAAFSDGAHLHLAVRGVDGGYWVTNAPYDVNGVPVTWRPWVALGGVFTSAPTIATAGPNLMTILGRGTDGAIFQMNWDGSRYRGWTSLGGVSVSAPAVERAPLGAAPGYIVSTVGLDGRIWRIPTGADGPGATGAWSGGMLPSSLGPQSDATGPTPAQAGTLTIGDSRRGVSLLNPANGSTINVGGVATSTVGIVREPDGGVDVYVRGTDGQLWASGWSPSRGVFSWQPLGGRLF